MTQPVPQSLAAAKIDLHHLANTPGFGRAAATLRKAGLWNEDAVELPRRWRILLRGRQEVEVSMTVTVIADTKERAVELAENEAFRTPGRWNIEHSGEVEMLTEDAEVLDAVAI